MPVHDPSSESFDWETIFESSDRCGETVARTCLFGQRRISQFSYYNMSAYNVVRDYVKNCPAKIKPRRAIFKIIPIMRNCIIRKTFFLGQFFSGTDRGRKNI